MALDRSIALLRGLPGVSAGRLVSSMIDTLRGVHLASAAGPVSGLHRIHSGVAGAELVVYLPESAVSRIPRIIEELRHRRHAPYQVLNDHGVLLISAVGSRPDGIRLAGGSHCEVVLRRRDDDWVVAKKVLKKAVADDTDAVRRHQNEAEWLTAVKRLSPMFIDVLSIADDADSYTFETEFFPAHSLAELVMQGCLSGDQLADELVSVYQHLQLSLYCHEPISTTWRDRDRTYVDKIRRRRRLLLDAASDNDRQLTSIMCAERVRVNGRACPSLTTLLRIVDSEPLWQLVVRPAGAHVCHGDLILEDILLRAGPHRAVKFVDPNPYNSHGILDLGKTMLSLWLGYELIYFDFFSVSAKLSTVDAETCIDVDILFSAGPHGERLVRAFELFMAYAERELCGRFDLPRHLFRRLILMTAALTALAIPAFHAVGHGRPDRALVFTSLGLLHASYALEGDYQDIPIYLRQTG